MAQLRTPEPLPQILHLEASAHGDDDPSDYRIMVSNSDDVGVLNMGDDPHSPAPEYPLSRGGTRIVYVSIDSGVYDQDDYCFPPALLSKLPPFPPGNWNKGHITKTEGNPEPHLAWTRYSELPRVNATWYDTFVDYNSLHFCSKGCSTNVMEASHPELGKVIAKFARFEWEIGYFEAETIAYHWIDGHGIGPKFLAHLTEGGRVIGFLLEKVEGHYAGIEDLARCEDKVRKLHSLGIVHGDLNRYNFLVTADRVTLIDFETCKKCQADAAKAKELETLRENLVDTSGRGGPFIVLPMASGEQMDETSTSDGGPTE